MLSEVLSDILAQTHGLGFIEMMKIDSSATETTIAAITEDKSVVAFGKLNSPLTELEGVVGLARMAVLPGDLKYPHFIGDRATNEMKTTQRDGSDIPCEISVTGNGDQGSS